MSYEITKNDYIKILEFYKKPIPKNVKLLKKNAEKLLNDKLCRCIKKINKVYSEEPKSIGICTKTIFNSKGITRGKFKCTKKKFLSIKKKTRKNLHF